MKWEGRLDGVHGSVCTSGVKPREGEREMVGGSIFRSTGQEGLSEKGSMSEEDTAGYHSEMFEIANAVTYLLGFSASRRPVSV